MPNSVSPLHLASPMVSRCARLLLAACLVIGFHSPAAVILGTPVITFDSTSAIISWKTDVATGARVSFGPSPEQLNQSQKGSDIATSHVLTLSVLQPGAHYYFAVGTARKRLATGEFTLPGGFVAAPKSTPSPVPARRHPFLASLFVLLRQLLPPARRGETPSLFQITSRDTEPISTPRTRRIMLAWPGNSASSPGAAGCS